MHFLEKSGKFLLLWRALPQPSTSAVVSQDLACPAVFINTVAQGPWHTAWQGRVGRLGNRLCRKPEHLGKSPAACTGGETRLAVQHGVVSMTAIGTGWMSALSGSCTPAPGPGVRSISCDSPSTPSARPQARGGAILFGSGAHRAGTSSRTHPSPSHIGVQRAPFASKHLSVGLVSSGRALKDLSVLVPPYPRCVAPFSLWKPF